MSNYTIYHNPRCRKSRETLALLNHHSVEPKIVLYLEEPLTKEDLKRLLKKLKIDAYALVRKNEAIYKEKFRGKEVSEDEWVEAMVQYPKLIERPIVVKGKNAVLGRPPENVLSLVS